MGTPEGLLDLSHAPVVDCHCHGFLHEGLEREDPVTFESRLSFAGMCYYAAAEDLPTGLEPDITAAIAGQRDSTPFILYARRALAEALGVPPEAEAVAAARAKALADDARGYVLRLLREQHVAALIADEGFPDRPVVPRATFEEQVGIPVCRAFRIENVVWALQQEEPAWAAFAEGFQEALEKAAHDPNTVAFKSIIAYLSGLAVEPVSASEAATAYERWRAGSYGDHAPDAKACWDYCLGLTLEVARCHELPLHIHCGGGDLFMRSLADAAPEHLFPLLSEHLHQPIVLIHGGFPWLATGAYLASLFPNVYLDVSEFQPWASLAVRGALEHLIGMVPNEKLLYGTDEASEPELLWLGARLFRAALQDVMQTAVRSELLTSEQAVRLAEGILAGNAIRLHGLESVRELDDTAAGRQGRVDSGAEPETAKPAESGTDPGSATRAGLGPGPGAA
jgi:predicted TIM-barrel fold metal-dependent hydrolase